MILSTLGVFVKLKIAPYYPPPEGRGFTARGIILTMENVTTQDDKPKTLLRDTSVVSIMTLISRVLGAVRDVIVMHMFGAGAAMDAFLFAFKLPNFMRRLFAEGAFAQAFVPVLSEVQTTTSKERVREFIADVAGTLSSVLFVITVIVVVGSPFVVMVFAPGFVDDPIRYSLATEMLRITFPYLMLISLTAFYGAILNTYGVFAIPAFTPVLLNVSLIGCALYLSPYLDVSIEALAWGVFGAGVIQLIFQLPSLHKRALLVRPRLNRDDKDVKRVLKLMVPALFGVSVAQINLLFDVVFASFLQAGSLTWLYTADRMMNFPLGIFGVAIATVILPHLSKQNIQSNKAQFDKGLDWGIRSVLFIALPAAVGLFMLAHPIISAIFLHGKFNIEDANMTSQALIAYSVGVPAFMLIKVLASGFYAKQNIRTPVKVGALCMGLNIIINLILIKPFAHVGLAMAITITASLNALLLFGLLFKKEGFKLAPGWALFMVRLVIACVLMGGVLYSMMPSPDFWTSESITNRALTLLGLVLAGGVSYLLTLLLSGLSFKSLIGDKFSKADESEPS